MNTKHIQINRQKVAALLLAGSILAAGLTWAGAEASGSTLQPTNKEQSWSQLGCAKGSKLGIGPDGRTDLLGCESELPSEFRLRSVKAGKMGGAAGGFD